MLDPAVLEKYQSRPGFDLVSYREVALPVYAITFEIMVLDEKPLPPIQEFVLRAADRSLGDVESIAGLLGIEQPIATRAAADLLNSDDLVVAGLAADDRQHRLRLTTKGKETLRAAKIIQPIETTATVFIDGLTREVLSASGRELGAFPMRYAQERGLVEIAPHPRRKPRFEEIPAELVAAAVAREGAGRRVKRDVIGVVGMGRSRSFAREALGLAYRTQTGDETQISFVVDGQPSDAHDAAFSRALKYSAVNVVPDEWESAIDVIARELPQEVIAQAAPEDESARLSGMKAAAQTEATELRRAAQEPQGTPESEATLRRRIDEAEVRERELLAAIESLSVRHVPVWDHPTYLKTAFEEARRRILIVSPWIRAEVVDNAFIGRLRRTLDRNVDVYIGYGIGEDRKEGRHPKAVERDKHALGELRRVAEQYANFHLADFGGTHAKVLACDARFSVVTSFNWLSFRGDRRLRFRDERGMYVGIPEQVNALFDEYAPRFS